MDDCGAGERRWSDIAISYARRDIYYRCRS